MRLSELQEKAHRIACDKGWWDGEQNQGEKIALMHSELSEALEALRKPVQGKLEGVDPVAEELADTVIRILDFCGYYGLDLEEAVLKKLAYNRSRPYRHGKAF